MTPKRKFSHRRVASTHKVPEVTIDHKKPRPPASSHASAESNRRASSLSPAGHSRASRPHISICHRIPLLSECLTASLNGSGQFTCHTLTPEGVLAMSPTSFGRRAIDLLLLDATLGGDHSNQVAERIKTLYPNCKIILLIAGHAIDRMFEFARIGSHGYLSEGMRVADVRVAILTVLGGQQYCSPQLVSALLQQVGRIDHSREQSSEGNRGPLTSRQREILELIALHELGNKQIARQLKLSLYTVKNHVHNIITILDVHDRHEAVQCARRRGFLGR